MRRYADLFKTQYVQTFIFCSQVNLRMLNNFFLSILTLDFYKQYVLYESQIKGGYQMANLGLELLIFTVLIIYFGVFMTQNIYKQY